MTTSLYRQMLRIRLVESKLLAMCGKGEAGDLHFSKGQEGIHCGVAAALRKTDYVCSHHRTISPLLARGADLRGLIAELLGRKTGLNAGRAGEMHISDPSVRHAFSFQLVGTAIPVATGLAWGLRKFHKTDDIVVVFVGDAASSNGAFHEGLTIAAIQKVPLLVVVENNGRAGNVTAEHYLPTIDVASRMSAYGIDFLSGDGNRVEDVRLATEHAIEIVRYSCRPFLLECHTQRLCPHKIGQGDVRTKEELEKLAERDPLLLEAERLNLSLEDRTAMHQEITREIDEVFAQVAKDEVAEWIA
jgi:acetoin:2,6-dichlorophenolindophenol oxidoreductase subunit alpha